MKVRETQIAACAFSAAIELAKEFFERCDEPGLAPMAASSARRRRSYVVVPDHTDRARHHEALRLGWCRHHALAPATFEGYLTVRPASGRAELILEGELAGTGSARELLTSIADFIEREWDHFVRSTPSVEACNARERSGMALA
ncbi:MAG: hypothetical protein NVS3B16_25370 [Vulcanimicrobiaceae bacterium]